MIAPGPAEAPSPDAESEPKYSREQRLDRACLRVAIHIRGLYEEKGSSDTRLLEGLLLPDELVIVGRSRALRDGDPFRREHVVPRLFIIEACHEMIERGQDDKALAAFIRDHTKIVLVTPKEAETMDRRSELGLKQTMPSDWVLGDTLFKRLELAGIDWDRDWRPIVGNPKPWGVRPQTISAYLAAWLSALNL